MLSGKKKLERKSRQLLTDLPLPPELPVGVASPASTHSPAEEKKNQLPRRRPKYGSTAPARSSLLPDGKLSRWPGLGGDRHGGQRTRVAVNSKPF